MTSVKSTSPSAVFLKFCEEFQKLQKLSNSLTHNNSKQEEETLEGDTSSLNDYEDPNSCRKESLPQLLLLEHELNQRGITQLTQLPISGEKAIIQFANNLPSDIVLFKTLQNLEFTQCILFPRPASFQISIGAFHPIGNGYNALKDRFSTQEYVIELGDLAFPTPIGYAVPQNLICTRLGIVQDIFHVFRSHSHFGSYRQNQLKLPIFSSNGFKWEGGCKFGYNIAHNKSYGDIAFTYVREYRQFVLKLDDSNSIPQLNSSFISSIKNLVSSSNYEPKFWKAFFERFGTHFVSLVFGGGRIVLTILEDQLKNFFDTNDLSNKEVTKSIARILSSILDGDKSCNFQHNGKQLLTNSIYIEGGSKSYHNENLCNVNDPLEFRKIIESWVQTIPFNPIILDTQIMVEPIVNLLHLSGYEAEAKAFDASTQKIFGKSFLNKRTK